jgi:hypothetical protein
VTALERQRAIAHATAVAEADDLAQLPDPDLEDETDA